jgi:ABC-type phosphate/phosphonate transport system permease subunit
LVYGPAVDLRSPTLSNLYPPVFHMALLLHFILILFFSTFLSVSSDFPLGSSHLNQVSSNVDHLALGKFIAHFISCSIPSRTHPSVFFQICSILPLKFISTSAIPPRWIHPILKGTYRILNSIPFLSLFHLFSHSFHVCSIFPLPFHGISALAEIAGRVFVRFAL